MRGSPGCTVYIGNLDEKVSERMLYEIMIQAGRIVNLIIPREKETDRSKGYAFVEYGTEEIADYAVRLFSGLVSLCHRKLKFAISGQDKVPQNLGAHASPILNSFEKRFDVIHPNENENKNFQVPSNLSSSFKFSAYDQPLTSSFLRASPGLVSTASRSDLRATGQRLGFQNSGLGLLNSSSFFFIFWRSCDAGSWSYKGIKLLFLMTLSKMPKSGNSTSGWAAFDTNHRKKHGIETENKVDSFPPLLDVISSDPLKNSEMNYIPSTRTFSSVVQPSAASASTLLGLKVIAGETSNLPTVEKLEKIYSWAEQSLIEDILSAVNNDEDQASALLKAMELPCFQVSEMDSTEQRSTREDQVDKSERSEAGNSLENHRPSENQVELISGQIFSVPIEPEWEDDDVYISHRKDAMRMIRLANQHSRAANNAYVRGDHFSARQLSLKAREEWLVAEKLNANAAKEILGIRNKIYDPWKLDLHGLHASEATSALKDHLRKIETNRPSYIHSPAHPDGDGMSSSLESVACPDTEGQEQRVLLGRRPKLLHVITGVGTHSKGQAALPATVRTFLIENGLAKALDGFDLIFHSVKKFCFVEPYSSPQVPSHLTLESRPFNQCTVCNTQSIHRIKWSHIPESKVKTAKLKSDTSVAELARLVMEAKGVPDIIVNNAGAINSNNKLWEVPVEEFDTVMDTNIKGTANVLRHFLPPMVERKQGIIVNMSSGWGRSAAAEVAPYCASKWAIEGLTRSVAKELPAGMAIVALSPGVINTDMLVSCFGSSASLYQTPDAWAPKAATMILNLTSEDNGASLSVA
ncbi:hypothetical protein H6P81_001415 [Aristolochia fimbriata]|uniref:RRM domain-containing protein n=1 Tax=Aristolochia fimbriata TaxID=158543 RepID=A0AAV7F6Y0_ARIFI|nr:hypothetical protein H6P81_001415 [Aristolochia fimbriata]